jgi:uncharacterized membrane protein
VFNEYGIFRLISEGLIIGFIARELGGWMKPVLQMVCMLPSLVYIANANPESWI